MLVSNIDYSSVVNASSDIELICNHDLFMDDSLRCV